MKTPEEIIGNELERGLHEPVPADDIIEALDAAGYVIVPKTISAPCPQIHAMFDVVERETDGKGLEVYMSV